MHNTIFEKIIAREIPAEIIYEDDLVIAFLDIVPVNVGHTLVVPKKKFVNIFDGDAEVLAHMMRIAQRIGKAVREATQCDGINIAMNNESAAGQEVFHAHIHIIPRFTDDQAFVRPKHVAFDPTIGAKIVASLRDT
jgi:histidine triad (HIT) family protein